MSITQSQLVGPSPAAIEKYRALMQSEHGVELTFEEAATQAERFLSLARVVLQPMPKQFLPHYKELLEQKESKLKVPSCA